jgi:nucleoid-associated protein YgaU
VRISGQTSEPQLQSHVQGVFRSPGIVEAPDATANIPKIRYRTVRNGESLRELASSFYGNPARWVDIYNANVSGRMRADGQDGPIRNPNQVSGMTLIIP